MLAFNYFLFILACVALLMVVVGGAWDIISHIRKAPSDIAWKILAVGFVIFTFFFFSRLAISAFYGIH